MSPTPTTNTVWQSMAQPDEQGMLGFFHTLQRLKTNKRTGWVNQKVKDPESIADHMYRMAMMALVLPSTPGQPPLDISRCVMMSLVHDMAEADVGDITPEHASGISKEQKHQMELAAMERIKTLLGHPSIASLRVESLYREYEDRQTPESRFVKDLDLFELAVQGVEYEDSNEVRTIQPFFETTVPRILHPTVKGWAKELMEQRRSLWTSRGWGADYVHVDVSSESEPTSSVPSQPSSTRITGNSASTDSARRDGASGEESLPREHKLTQRVYGSHEETDVSQ